MMRALRHGPLNTRVSFLLVTGCCLAWAKPIQGAMIIVSLVQQSPPEESRLSPFQSETQRVAPSRQGAPTPDQQATERAAPAPGVPLCIGERVGMCTVIPAASLLSPAYNFAPGVQGPGSAAAVPEPWPCGSRARGRSRHALLARACRIALYSLQCLSPAR